MKQSIQDKINEILSLPKSPVLVSSNAVHENEDSLKKAIRNTEDATIFMAELEAVIKAAQTK